MLLTSLQHKNAEASQCTPLSHSLPFLLPPCGSILTKPQVLARALGVREAFSAARFWSGARAANGL